jgi:hypothetical protein
MSRMRDIAQKSTLQALGQIESHNSPINPEISTSDVATESNEVEISFSIEKRVGDAKITAWGHAGQEAEARNKVNEAAKNFRGQGDT